MKCPKCGAEMREGAHFCNQCGARFEQQTQIPHNASRQSRLLSIVQDMKWTIIIFAILSLCCMSSTFFLGFRTNWILWKLGLR